MSEALDLLREYLSDPTPESGDEDPPMFSDARLEAMLARADGDPERAAADGWKMKAANYAEMVDVTEGNASRAMSDLQDHALNMSKTFEKSRSGPTEGRTTIGRIRRGR